MTQPISPVCVMCSIRTPSAIHASTSLYVKYGKSLIPIFKPVNCCIKSREFGPITQIAVYDEVISVTQIGFWR